MPSSWSLKSSLLREQWPRVKHQLKPALKEYYREAEQAVQQGTEQVYRIGDTVMLLRSETLDDDSNELVVVALVGDMASGTLGAVNHARAHGFESIRAHFFRAGAERFIRKRLKLPVREIDRRGDERVLRIRFADMGGRSSSSSHQRTITTTTNTSGSAAAGGDNYGMMLSGVNNSDINLSMTDHGAMAVAGDMAEEAFNFGVQSLQSNQAIVGNALGTVDNTVDDAFAFGTSALEETSEVSQYAIDSIKSMAGQQSETTKAAIAMAGDTKSRDQSGDVDSDNSLLKNMSLIVGIAGTIITVAFLVTRKAS